MKSVKLLHRYIIREFLPPFAIGLSVFTFLLVIRQLVLVMDLFLNRGVDLLTIFKMTSLVLPMFLPLSIPMAVLLAALLSYGRLSEDGEITAFRSAGLPLIQYSIPNIIFGLFLSFLLIYFNLNLAPRAAMEFKRMHFKVAQQNPLALFSSKVVNNFGEYQIYVEKMDRRKMKISGVTIYKLNPESGPTRILAPTGQIISTEGNGLTISLENGAIHQPSQEKESNYTITKFNKFSLKIPTGEGVEQIPISSREMTYSDLKEKALEAINKNLSPVIWKAESHMRIAVAFAPLMFVLLGTVLGVRVRRGSKSIGVGMSLIVIIIYYGLLVFTTSVSSQRVIPPLLLAWIPNLITLSVGGILWVKVAGK